LCLLDDRELPDWLHYSQNDQLRLLIPGTHYADLCSLAFDQIRQNLRGSIAVSLHMLDIMAMVLEVTKHHERRKLLLKHAGLVRDDAMQQMKLQADREVIEERFSKLPAE